MKKLIPYILYAISVFFTVMCMAQLAWSDIDMLEGLSIDTNSTIEGTSGLDTIEGSSVSGGGGCSGAYGNTGTDTTTIGEGTNTWMAVTQPGNLCVGTSASIAAFLEYIVHDSASSRYSMVVYANSGGSPGSLKGYVVGTHDNNSPAVQITETLAQSMAVDDWIGIIAEENVLLGYDATTGGTSRFEHTCSAAYNNPPSTWGSGCSTDSDYNAYVLEVVVNY